MKGSKKFVPQQVFVNVNLKKITKNKEPSYTYKLTEGKVIFNNENRTKEMKTMEIKFLHIWYIHHNLFDK